MSTTTKFNTLGNGKEPGDSALTYQSEGFFLIFQLIQGIDAFHFPEGDLWREIMPPELIGIREQVATHLAQFAEERPLLRVLRAEGKDQLGSIVYLPCGARTSIQIGRTDNPLYTGEARAAFESARPII